MGDVKLVTATQISKTNLTLAMASPRNEPPAFILPPRNARVSQGGTARFEGKVRGYPEPHVTWHRDGKPLTPGDHHAMEQSPRGGFSLVVRTVREEDAGRYTCHAANDAGSCQVTVELTAEGNAERRFYLPSSTRTAGGRTPVVENRPSIWGESPPKFVTKPSRLYLRAGQSGKLSAKITGRPQPQVLWLRGEAELPSGGRFSTFERQGVHYLEVTDARAEDAGTYTCFVVNSAGKATATAELMVQGSCTEGDTQHSSSLAASAAVVPKSTEPLTVKHTSRGPVRGDPPTGMVERKETAEGLRTGVQPQKLQSEAMVEHPSKAMGLGSSQPPRHGSDSRTGRKFERAGDSAERMLPETTSLEPAREVRRFGRDSRLDETRSPPLFDLQPQSQEVLEGSKVTFRCQVSGVPAPTLSWIKDGLVLRGGAGLRIQQEGNLHLLCLDRVRKEDSGSFGCAATNSKGQASATWTLLVKSIRADGRAPVFSSVLQERTVNEGQDFVLRCSVQGRPSPRIAWVLNDQPLTLACCSYEAGDARLEVRGAQLGDAGSYVCVAENTHGRAACSAAVIVRERKTSEGTKHGKASEAKKPLAPAFLRELADLQVLDGSRVCMTVKVAGCPQPQVAWLHNGQEVQESEDFHFERRGSEHSLVIQEVFPEDTGKYTCEAWNELGGAHTEATLTVQEPQDGVQPWFITKPKSLTACLGQHSLLSCAIAGDPFPQFQWKKAGRVLSSGLDYEVLQKEDVVSLLIRRVKAHHAGDYEISLKNKVGGCSCVARVLLSEEPVGCTGSAARPPQLGACQGAGGEDSPEQGGGAECEEQEQEFGESLDSRGLLKRRVETRQHGEEHIRQQEAEQRDFRGVLGRKVDTKSLSEEDLKEITAEQMDFRANLQRQVKPKTLSEDERKINAPQQVDFRSILGKKGAGGPKADPGKVEPPKNATTDFRSVLSNKKKPAAVENNTESPAPKEAPKVAPKEVPQVPKVVPKEAPKEVSQVPKVAPKEVPQIPKVVPKEAPKEVSKVAPKEIPQAPKEVPQIPKVAPKEAPKEVPKVAPKEIPQAPKEVPQIPKVAPKEVPKEAPKVAPKEVTKEAHKEAPKVAPKEVTKEAHKEVPKDAPKEVSKEAPQIPKVAPKELSKNDINCVDGRINGQKNGGVGMAPVFTQALSDASVLDGERLQLECQVSAEPPATITWTLDGKVIKPSKFILLSEQEGHCFLTIDKALPEDEGQYKCRAENAAGRVECACMVLVDDPEDTSATAADKKTRKAAPTTENEARIKKKPAPKTPPKQGAPPQVIQFPEDMKILAGEKVDLLCKFGGAPPITCTWLKFRKPIPEGKDDMTMETAESTSQLTIYPTKPDHSGCYTIELQNKFGTKLASLNLTIVDKPDPPARVPAASDIRKSSLTLSWYGPTYDGGSVVQSYNLEIWNSVDKEWKPLTSCKSTSFNVQDLMADRQYKFRVRAVNIYGTGEPSAESDPVTVGVEEEEKKKVEEEEEPEASDEETKPEYRDVVIKTDQTVKDFYNVEERLGTGKFGQVFKLVEKSSKKVWAGKFIKAFSAKDKESVRQEIGIMNCLHHPKLVQCVDAFEGKSDIVMVMEMISGGELFERIIDEDFELSEREVIKYMLQIIDGVNFIHNQDIVHLDLKPENIMCVNKTGSKIKLIDFGLARRLENSGSLKVLFGTPEFVAPEVINYEPISYQTDMWSIGVICYILVSGLSPFMGDDDNETLSNVTSATWDFEDEAFDEISEEAKDFISKLLKKNLKARLTCPQCLDHPWLKQDTKTMEAKQLSKERMKKYLLRRKWQKTGHAVRAIGRLSSMAMLSGISAKKGGSPTGNPTEDDLANQLLETIEDEEKPHTKPIFITVIKDVEVVEGSAARFDCKIEGYPDPDVVWYKDDQPIKETRHFQIDYDEEGKCSLVISEVSSDDDAKYTCKAVNSLGEATCTAELLVEFMTEEEGEDAGEEGEGEEE
uniref:Myosin light chain kinase, smooth muscle n=2 Tax=Paramormyrops kingsleyae TaxID=1676925 RepID=A0A3B3SL14_9TELE|nr:myosin light chain kinase, smooth muscle-like isoform X2 [Paramormyrops kingsleyae]